MSDSVDQLLAIADRVVAMAAAGEQVEAYVSRESETSIRIYEGEVEHFVSAQSEGIGIRVIQDGRTGFSYAGTLDDEAVAIALEEARDNVAFGTRDEWVALAEPDGVDVVDQQLWSEALAALPDGAQGGAGQGPGADGAGPSTRAVRVDDANYADVAGESAVASTTGIRRSGRENGCYLVVSHAGRRRRRDPDRVRLHRRPLARRLRPRQGRRRRVEPGHPPARCHQARRRGGSPWCSTRTSPPASSASLAER